MNNTLKWVIGLIVVIAIIWFGFMNKADVQEEVVVEDTTTEEVTGEVATEEVDTEATEEESAE